MSSPSADADDEVIDAAVLPRSVSPHPLALRRIAVARFCERLAFYSMRHWLIAYMLILSQRGAGDAASFYQYYHWIVAALAFVQVPGGLVIDLGYSRRKAVVWGGAMIAVGYFLLALDHPVAMAVAALSCLLGMALYSPSTYTALGSYYRGREAYLTAGMYYHNAFVNLGAFLASLFIGFLAIRLNWQQGAMLAAIVMMAGHVYLLAIARVFDERKLPTRPAMDAEEPEISKTKMQGYMGWLLPLAFIGFAIYCFAIQGGQNSANAWAATAPGMRDWSKLGGMAMIVLSIFAALFGSYLFTQQPQRLGVLLGLGFLITVPAGLLLPGLMGMVGHGLSGNAVAAFTALAILGVVAADFLVVAPMYSVVLAKGGGFKNTLIGGLSFLIYLPYFNVLFPQPMDMQSALGAVFGILSVVVLAFTGVWMWRRGE